MSDSEESPQMSAEQFALAMTAAEEERRKVAEEAAAREARQKEEEERQKREEEEKKANEAAEKRRAEEATYSRHIPTTYCIASTHFRTSIIDTFLHTHKLHLPSCKQHIMPVTRTNTAAVDALQSGVYYSSTTASSGEPAHDEAAFFRWDYAGGKVSQEDNVGGDCVSKSTTAAAPPHCTGGVSTHSFVVCFPGDRLPSHLAGVGGASLTAAEEKEVAAFVQTAAAARPIAAMKHVLDLQDGPSIDAVMRASFPPLLLAVPSASSDETENAPSPRRHTTHYLTVFAERITSEGYSSYTQLFGGRGGGDGGGGTTLTASGEPSKGTYTSSCGATATATGAGTAVNSDGNSSGSEPSAIATAPPKSLVSLGQLVAHCLGQHGSGDGAITSLDLVGFSKGCTALNQIVADIGGWGNSRCCCVGGLDDTTGPEATDSPLGAEWTLGVHYVDGGLNSAGAFLSDRRTLEAFRGVFTEEGDVRKANARCRKGLLVTSYDCPSSTSTASASSTFSSSLLPLVQCKAVDYSVYSTPRQRMDPHRPFLDYERRMMAMHLCGVSRSNGKGTASAADSLVLQGMVGAFMVAAAPRYFTLKKSSAAAAEGGAVGGGAAATSLGGSSSGLPLQASRPPHFPPRGVTAPLRCQAQQEAERDWADTTVPCDTHTMRTCMCASPPPQGEPVRFRVRVLEDVPPPSRRDGEGGEINAAMEGLRQHMLAMVRFGAKYTRE